jgi:hypothetical protein
MTVDTAKPRATFSELVSDIKDFFRNVREERFDLQSASLCMRRAKNAVRNMRDGQLSHYEAEDAAELANDAYNEYAFYSDTPSCVLIIPVWAMILAALALLFGELLLAANVAFFICDYFQPQSEALLNIATFGSAIAICAVGDLLCIWLTYKVCNFIVKFRADRLDKTIDALDKFLQK